MYFRGYFFSDVFAVNKEWLLQICMLSIFFLLPFLFTDKLNVLESKGKKCVKPLQIKRYNC